MDEHGLLGNFVQLLVSSSRPSLRKSGYAKNGAPLDDSTQYLVLSIQFQKGWATRP